MRSIIEVVLVAASFGIIHLSDAHQDKFSNASPNENSKNSATVSSGDAGRNKDVAWDEFNHRGTLTWACRNIYTGNFVNITDCADKPKFDMVWPDKNVPGNYTGGGMADSATWPPKAKSEGSIPEAPKLK